MVRRFFFIICMLEGAGRAVNRTQTQPTRSRCSNSNAIAIEICSVIFAVIEKQTNILFGCRLYSVVVNSVEICSSQRRCSNREGNKYIFMCVSFVGHPADVAPTSLREWIDWHISKCLQPTNSISDIVVECSCPNKHKVKMSKRTSAMAIGV